MGKKPEVGIAPEKLLTLLAVYEAASARFEKLESDLIDARAEVKDLEEEVREQKREISLLEDECGELTREIEGGARAD
jgi:predicted RNase H-like nuclease (RuvC/YqgF family)